MKLTPILLELYGDEHYLDRFAKRVVQNKVMDVVIEYQKDKVVAIGTYNIPPELTDKLLTDFKFLHDKTSNSLSRFNFGVKMHIFDMVDIINNKANLNRNITEDVKSKILKNLADNKIQVYLREKETGSMGLALVTSIVNNRMVTTMFVKQSDDDFINTRMKGGYEYFILDSPYDIDQYLDMSSL